MKGILHLKDAYFSSPLEHLYRCVRFAKKNGITASATSTIIDAGAYDGLTSLFFHKHFPQAHILAFEPNPDAFALAKKNTAHCPQIELVPAAVSDHSGSTSLHVSFNQVSSSLHNIDENFIRDEKNASLRSQLKTENEVEVKVLRLDDLHLEEVLILKMDLQGNELLTIKGAKETLRHTYLVVTEMSIKGVYANGAQYYETDQALRELGFEAVDWIIPSRREGVQAMEFDAIYVNRNWRS